jgi:chemotaxis protein histidine kinase CheA
MSSFASNALNWFRKKSRPAARPKQHSRDFLKTPARPRKSGEIFMHLINIQKSLKSIALAMRQQIDFTWLVQKAKGHASLLKLEAETMGEEELAGVAGQVEAYFDTVSEGRLDLDEEGLTVILDFVIIYKRTIADAVSEMSPLNKERLDEWSSRYQALMARMEPSFEEALLGDKEDAFSEPEPLFEEPEPATDDAAYVLESDENEEIEEPSTHVLVEADHADEPDAATEPTAEAPPGFIREAPEGLGEPGLEEAVEEEADPFEQMEEFEAPPDDELPIYDPSKEIRAHDAVISDAEIRTAREYMEIGKSRPELKEPERDGVSASDPLSDDYSPPPLPDHKQEPSAEPHTELQEVEGLKARLSQVHEKHELLLSKMNTIVSGYKEAVQYEADESKLPCVEDLDTEDLDTEDLEDIIFIGRNRG